MSLSGLSGILAGIYALAAAAYAHFRIAALPDYSGDSVVLNAVGNFMAAYDLVGDLFFVATLTLFLAIVTGALLTYRKAKKLNEKIWNPVSKRLLAHFGIPLFAGGLFCLVLLQYGIVGLALLNASKFTIGDIKYLGIANMFIGLIASQFVGYGLYFWALGFGIFHIIYGVILYNKYDR